VAAVPGLFLPRMATVSVGRDLAVSPDVAWDMLTRTRFWPGWGPSVSAVEPTDARIGPDSTGRVRTAVGVWLPFAVTDWDEGRSWSWRVAGLPATGHRVEPTATGCRVSFDVPAVAAPYLVVCRIALGRIDRLARQAP